MTRDDIRKKLIYNQNQIGNIRTTINEQESQIENLEGLRNSFNRLLNDFNYKHNMQNARISDVNNMSYINSKIVSSYTSAMHGVVNGSEYRKACNEIYRATGIKPVSKDDDGTEQEYDYIGVIYPEGYLNDEFNFLFNHYDVNDVVFRGYENPERVEFIEYMEGVYSKEKDNQ